MYKLGIDVGGTNTDAVLIDDDRNVVAEVKYPTSGDIYDGILGAVRACLKASGINRAEISQAMLGTPLWSGNPWRRSESFGSAPPLRWEYRQ